MTKARACKGAGQEWAQESYFMLMGVQKSVKDPSELPLAGVKIHSIEKFLISLERSWNLDI